MKGSPFESEKLQLSADNKSFMKSDTSHITVDTSKTGLPVPSVVREGKSIPLHSRFDPAKEAARFVEQIDVASHNLFVVCGFAFAYHIEMLLEGLSDTDVLLVIEKDPGMVKSACEHRNLERLLADRRLLLLIDPSDDILSSCMRGKSSRSVVFVTHRGSFRIDRAYYENVIHMVKSYLSSKEVNIATLAKFQKLWTINCGKNMIHMIRSVPVHVFYDKFSHCDAVVVGAGPSLRESLPELRSIQHKTLVIAVDTSFKICLENGVTPHFVLCADPQLINARYFEQTGTSDAVLVADPACHPSVLRLYKGPVALSSMPFDMFSWIEEITGKMGEITHGGSVSTNAYDFARRLGVGRIFLVGQDLGFSHGLAHCRGSYLDEMMFLLVNRYFNQEMFNRKQLTALPGIYQDAVEGGKVRTNQKMMIFKQWFEKRRDPLLCNATPAGMKLSGIEGASLGDVKQSDDPRLLISSLYKGGHIGEEEVKRRTAEASVKLERVSNENELLGRKLSRAVLKAQELNDIVSGRAKGNPGQCIDELNAIDEYIGNMSSSKSIVGMTVQQTIHTIQEGYDVGEGSDSEQIAKRSLYLYSGLLEGCRFTGRVLEKIIRTFDSIF